MKQNLTAIDTVRLIKKIILEENSKIEDLHKLINRDAIIESPVNFEEKKGADGLVTVIRYWQKAFPDVSSTWQSTEQPDNNTVLINWKAKGTHSGSSFLDIPAKGNNVLYEGKTIYKFCTDGKLAHYGVFVDIQSIKKQVL